MPPPPKHKLVLLAILGLACVVGAFLIPTRLYWQLSRPWLHKETINRHALAYGVDPLLVLALVRVESGFSAKALSHRGALGLMQLMPETGREMAQRAGLPLETLNLEDPETNIRLGVLYLSLMFAEFKEDTHSVLAAYNAGPKKVRSWRKGKALRLEDIPFPETRSFVEKVENTQKFLLTLRRVKRVFHD